MITSEYWSSDSGLSRAAVISSARSQQSARSRRGAAVPTHVWSLTRSDQSIGGVIPNTPKVYSRGCTPHVSRVCCEGGRLVSDVGQHEGEHVPQRKQRDSHRPLVTSYHTTATRVEAEGCFAQRYCEGERNAGLLSGAPASNGVIIPLTEGAPVGDGHGIEEHALP